MSTKAPADKVIKSYVSATVEPLGDRLVRFLISSSSVDRDNDMVSQSGWRLDTFLANPVICWSHDYSQPPIGRATSVSVGAKGLSAEIEFCPKGLNPFADMVCDLVKAGFLNAISVGFRPLKYVFNDERKGMDFYEQELLEASICAIPANPQCLIEARAAGIDVEPLRDWAEKTLAALPAKATEPEMDAMRSKIADAVDAIAELVEKVETATVGKKGRVVSAKNQQKIQQAHDHAVHIQNCMKDLLSQIDPDGPEENPDVPENINEPRKDEGDEDQVLDALPNLPAGTGNPGPDKPSANRPLPYAPAPTSMLPRTFEPTDIIVVEIPADEPETLSVDPEKFQSALMATLSDMCAAETRKALNYQRGRIE